MALTLHYITEKTYLHYIHSCIHSSAHRCVCIAFTASSVHTLHTATYLTLHYITFNCITNHHIASHCITQHFIQAFCLCRHSLWCIPYLHCMHTIDTWHIPHALNIPCMLRIPCMPCIDTVGGKGTLFEALYGVYNSRSRYLSSI